MQFGKSILGVFVGIAATSAVASASSVAVTAALFNTNDSPAGVQPGTTDLTVQFGTTMITNAFVGQLNWHSAGPAANLATGLNQNLENVLVSPDNTFSTFCIEGLQDVFFGMPATWNLGVVDMSTAPTPGTPMGPTTAGELTELWNRDYGNVGTDNELGAAFQLAIWEILNDGITTLGGETAADFAGGNFQATGDATAINDAVSMINDITGGSYQQNFTLFALSDSGIQDQIFAVPTLKVVVTGGSPPGVPLPAALPAGLALLSGLGVAKFLRRRS